MQCYRITEFFWHAMFLLFNASRRGGGYERAWDGSRLAASVWWRAQIFFGGGKNVFVHTKGTRNALSMSPKMGFTRAKVSNIGRIDPNQLVREILPSSATSRHRRGHVNR